MENNMKQFSGLFKELQNLGKERKGMEKFIYDLKSKLNKFRFKFKLLLKQFNFFFMFYFSPKSKVRYMFSYTDSQRVIVLDDHHIISRFGKNKFIRAGAYTKNLPKTMEEAERKRLECYHGMK
jgi:hypothetical protein